MSQLVLRPKRSTHVCSFCWCGQKGQCALKLTRAETQLGAFSRPLSEDPQHEITTRCSMGSSKKSRSKGILESCGLLGAKRVFAMEYQDKGLSLCKFSRYLVFIKIMDIRHKICHIYCKNTDFESIFSQKDSLYCCCMCAKFSSTCKIIFIFSSILSSVLWDSFSWMTVYIPDVWF